MPFQSILAGGNTHAYEKNLLYKQNCCTLEKYCSKPVVRQASSGIGGTATKALFPLSDWLSGRKSAYLSRLLIAHNNEGESTGRESG